MSTDLDQMGLNDVEMNPSVQNQAEKRAHHNALERKRRDHIKGSFGDLRDVIPLLKGEKASRAHILKSATEYIRTMKPKNHQRQKAIADLKRQNALLETQIHLLERMKETGLYTQTHQTLIKSDNNLSDDGIQTTRNLLNYSTI